MSNSSFIAQDLVGEAFASHASPRHLSDDVLQSAEQAVLSNPASVTVVSEQQSGGFLSRHEASIAAYVARKPVQSALMAIAAGGLAAALLRSALGRRQNH